MGAHLAEISASIACVRTDSPRGCKYAAFITPYECRLPSVNHSFCRDVHEAAGGWRKGSVNGCSGKGWKVGFL